jgi:ABC-type ATPase with predicted acetyltransferase domain
MTFDQKTRRGTYRYRVRGREECACCEKPFRFRLELSGSRRNVDTCMTCDDCGFIVHAACGSVQDRITSRPMKWCLPAFERRAWACLDCQTGDA